MIKNISTDHSVCVGVFKKCGNNVTPLMKIAVSFTKMRVSIIQS